MQKGNLCNSLPTINWLNSWMVIGMWESHDSFICSLCEGSIGILHLSLDQKPKTQIAFYSTPSFCEQALPSPPLFIFCNLPSSLNCCKRAKVEIIPIDMSLFGREKMLNKTNKSILSNHKFLEQYWIHPFLTMFEFLLETSKSE